MHLGFITCVMAALLTPPGGTQSAAHGLRRTMHIRMSAEEAPDTFDAELLK
jgi:hypothetical protein